MAGRKKKRWDRRKPCKRPRKSKRADRRKSCAPKVRRRSSARRAAPRRKVSGVGRVVTSKSGIRYKKLSSGYYRRIN